MSIRSLFQTPMTRRPIRRDRPVSRLELESLEDRRTPSFSPAMNFPAGTAPLSVISADFNGDSKLDLAAANVDGSIRVLIGNGDGTFQPAINSASGAGTLSMAVGDFNSDGKMDLASASPDTANVRIHKGNGDGTFQAPTSANLGYIPTSLAVGDFNADGKLDIGATWNFYMPGTWGYYGWYPGWYEGYATVLVGNGDSFTEAGTAYLGYGYHTGAVAEDFNGDLKLDFASVSSDGYAAKILFGTGTGALGAANYYYSGYYARSLDAADLNGDGFIDVAMLDQYQGSVVVMMGNALGGLGGAQSYSAGSVPTSLAIGDFNGDDILDLAATNAGPGTLSVLLGTGSGSFRPPVTAAGAGVEGLAIGDLDGDGRLDAATANSPTNSVAVLLNDGIWPSLDAPSIAITDATVTEGNAGTVNANFTVSLSKAYSGPVTVQFATADGSATLAGGDYQQISGTLTFAPGELSKSISVPVNGDRLAESGESFFVQLSNPTNSFIADATGIGSIQDDEPILYLESYTSVVEGNTGTTAYTFTVSLSAPYDAPVSVNFVSADLTPDEQYWYGPGATAGVDYQAASGTLTIPANQNSGTITVLVNGDRLVEYDEYFFLKLENATGAHIGSGLAFATIVDDEPRVSIEGTSVTEGNTGTKDLNFTVKLSAPSDVPVDIDFATGDGNATVADGDYVAKSGTITFAPGETSKTIAVSVKGDRLAEYDEYLIVELSDPSGAMIYNWVAYGTIVDNEPRLSISSEELKEGHKGTRVMTFTVTLAEAYDQVVSVRYKTYDDTARVSNSDYVATSGKLTFAPGETSKTINVTIKGDKRKENDEYFYILLSEQSSNATLWSNYGWGVILDDDRRF